MSLDNSEFFEQVTERREQARSRQRIINAAMLPGGQRRRLDTLVEKGGVTWVDEYDDALDALALESLEAEVNYRALLAKPSPRSAPATPKIEPGDTVTAWY